VGNTPFVAIVQQRPDPLIEREAEIVVGQLVDLTGSTSHIGEPYAEGVQAYADWLNAQEGINRKKVRLVRVDYANRIPEALEIYSRLKTVDRVVAIQGWGTGDTEALAQQLSQDLIPMFSASCSAHLADPRTTPYNFFVAADYSTQLRAGLKYLRDTWRETRKPKVAFVYPDHPYGRAPIPAGKAYAHELGFEIVGEENVDLNAISAARQIRNLKVKEPDFTWIGGSTPSTAVILKDARSLGLRTRFLINQWGNDENLMELEEAQGVLGLQASVLLGDDVPGMKAIREATRGESRATHYVRGWVSMMVLCEGLRRAEMRGELTGPGIKKALETLSDFDPQGLMPPISYTADDHRPSMAVRIYEYSGGKMLHRSTVDVERRPEWLGF
jgi:branched-chain amino acid transport system substrate-binding protein